MRAAFPAVPNDVSPASMQFAGLFRRLAAYALDCVVLFVGLLAVQASLYVVNPIVAAQRAGEPVSSIALHAWVFATASLPFWLYFTSMLRARRQATLGMRWMRIEVVRTDGSRLSFARAAQRSAVLLIPFEVNHALLFHVPFESAPTTFWIGSALVWALIVLYVVSILLSRERRSVHDFAAGTLVRLTS